MARFHYGRKLWFKLWRIWIFTLSFSSSVFPVPPLPLPPTSPRDAESKAISFNGETILCFKDYAVFAAVGILLNSWIRTPSEPAPSNNPFPRTALTCPLPVLPRSQDETTCKSLPPLETSPDRPSDSDYAQKYPQRVHPADRLLVVASAPTTKISTRAGPAQEPPRQRRGRWAGRLSSPVVPSCR